MPNDESLGRIMAAATHDLRNSLAVMRECTGLAEDVLRLSPQTGRECTRVLTALGQVQEQIRRGANLCEGMGYLAACAGGEGDTLPGRCDLNRVVRDFCILMARRSKGCALELRAKNADEPLTAPAEPLEVFYSLLRVFDACASVGGGVCLQLTPLLRKGEHVIAIDLKPDDDNGHMVLAALTSCPLIRPDPGGERKGWLPWGRKEERRFLLPVGAAAQ